MANRWWFLSGAGFGLLLVVGFILENGNLPESKAPDGEWTKLYSSSSDRAAIIVGAVVMLAAGLAFIWFAAMLRTALTGGPSTSPVLGSVAAGSAVVFVTLELVAALTMAAVAGSISFGDSPVPSADFARQFSQLGIGLLLLPGGWVAALFVATTSRLGFVAGLFARGMAVFGYAVAVLLLFGAAFFPFLTLPLWAIILGVTLARRPSPSTVT